MTPLCAFTSTAAEKSHSLSVVLAKPENARTETVLPDLRLIEIPRLNLYLVQKLLFVLTDLLSYSQLI